MVRKSSQKRKIASNNNVSTSYRLSVNLFVCLNLKFHVTLKSGQKLASAKVHFLWLSSLSAVEQWREGKHRKDAAQCKPCEQGKLALYDQKK